MIIHRRLNKHSHTNLEAACGWLLVDAWLHAAGRARSCACGETGRTALCGGDAADRNRPRHVGW